jgi:hypothetical protein
MSSERNWQAVFNRVATMDRAELTDRLKQEMFRRYDAARHFLGLAPRATRLIEGAAPAAQFFFSKEEVPGLVALLRERMPQQAQRIVERAGKILTHHFDLLGFKDLDYGQEIRWHSDRVHRRRAPRRPWFQIRYLDFDEAGDVKVTWELNRHQHLVTLAKAYRLTNDERYAEELFRQWYHWRSENPFSVGINWASSLEVAFRSLSWCWVRALLEGTPVVPPEFPADMRRALDLSGYHIDRYLSTYFSPNTHLLGEAVALFFIGTLCPELREAATWRGKGWKLVLAQAERQVQSDGLHFEQSTYYHVYAIDLFLHAGLLAARNGISTPPSFDTTVERMLDALLLLSRAGQPPRFGDDDGGRLFDADRNLTRHLLDPLATGAVVFGRGDFKYAARSMPEETLWLLGEQGVQQFDQIAPQAPPLQSAALSAGGIYMMTSSTPEPRQMLVDCGPQGFHTAGHGHADALSVQLISAGRPLLIDPGTLEYMGDGKQRNQFRGTAAHNTLRIDSLDQAEPSGPFSWSQKADGKLTRWIAGDGFDLFAGMHEGYKRLPKPVLHERWIFHRKGEYWLVRDLVVGSGRHRLEVSWHLAPGLMPLGQDAVFAETAESAGVALITARKHGWEQTISVESWSPVYGQKDPARVVRFSREAEVPAEFVTVVLPVASANTQLGILDKMGEAEASDVSGYRYSLREQEQGICFARSGVSWKLGEWASDAEFLYYRRVGASLKEVVFCHGSYVEYAGRRLASSPQPVTHCELRQGEDKTQAILPDGEQIVVEVPLGQLKILPAAPAFARPLSRGADV